MKDTKPKILVIVGPTASGKTALSITLAQKYNGEVISADSRQVYRGLDIGTGKVTKEEMRDVPHHMLNIAEPKDTYTVADYVRDGRCVITEILSRNKLPIVVGGTFLYIDALLGKVSTPEVPPNEELRSHLETLNEGKLLALLSEKDPTYALRIDPDNKRRLIRALEIVDALGVVPETKTEEVYSPFVIGMRTPKEELEENIKNRLTIRLDTGMVAEIENLHAEGLSYERLSELGIEYKYITQFLKKEIQEAEMKNLIEVKSLQYAKRQMTWLKRDTTIHWIDTGSVVGLDNHIHNFLS